MPTEFFGTWVSIAALVCGGVASTWRFAPILAMIAFVWVKGIFVFAGGIPELAPSLPELSGGFLGAAMLGLIGQALRRGWVRMRGGKAR